MGMKVLQLCIKPPIPSVDGGTLAMNSITQGLWAAGHEVRLLSVCSDKHPVRREAMSEQYLSATRFEAVPIDLSVRPLDALVTLLCGESYHVKRFISKAFERRLREILCEEEFDVVHVESIFLAPYVEAIRQCSDAKVVLRAHNVEHLIWRRVAKQTRNPFKRWYLKQLALALGAYERERLNVFDGVVSITPQDADQFRQMGCRRPLASIPFGVAVPEKKSDLPVEPASLYHIGAMDWMPNEESIRWFLKEVWPSVHRQVPQAKLYLAGRKMPADLLQGHLDGVVVAGEVDDARAFLADKQINVVPLLSGSGIRVKIIEAMSEGKAVITTPVGAAGIHYTDGDNLLLAQTPEDFVRQIKRCVDDQSFCQRVGVSARSLIEEEYSLPKLTARLVQFYETLR